MLKLKIQPILDKFQSEGKIDMTEFINDFMPAIFEVYIQITSNSK